MRTEVDLTKLTPHQREVLTDLVRRLSKNEAVRLLQIVDATTRSAKRRSRPFSIVLKESSRNWSASTPPEACEARLVSSHRRR
jgi:hypothetical protein